MWWLQYGHVPVQQLVLSLAALLRSVLPATLDKNQQQPYNWDMCCCIQRDGIVPQAPQ